MYNCIRCGYSTQHKGTFIRHIERTNRCKNKHGNFSKNEIYEKNGMEMKINKSNENDKPAKPAYQEDKPEAKPAYQKAKPTAKPAYQKAKPTAKPAYQEAKPEAKPTYQEAKPTEPDTKLETKLDNKLDNKSDKLETKSKTGLETKSKTGLETKSKTGLETKSKTGLETKSKTGLETKSYILDKLINKPNIIKKEIKSDFRIIKEDIINIKSSKNTYNCKYCGKSFKHYQSRYKHEKSRCPKREIKPKKKKVQADGSILPYNDTNKQFLTDDMIKKCMEKQNRCVPEIIKLVHFNNKHPENMNLCISNLKNDYVMVFDGEEWIVKNRDDMFDKLISDSEKILQSKFMKWFDTAKEDDKYNKAVGKFKKYLDKSSNQTLINSIKKELKLLLYNTRNKKKNPLKDCIITEVYT